MVGMNEAYEKEKVMWYNSSRWYEHIPLAHVPLNISFSVSLSNDMYVYLLIYLSVSL